MIKRQEWVPMPESYSNTKKQKVRRFGIKIGLVGSAYIFLFFAWDAARGWTETLSQTRATAFEKRVLLRPDLYEFGLEVVNPQHDNGTESTAKADIQVSIDGKEIRIDSLERSGSGSNFKDWSGPSVKIRHFGIYRIKATAVPFGEPLLAGDSTALSMYPAVSFDFDAFMIQMVCLLIAVLFVLVGGGCVLYSFFTKSR
jgi:hypothetical protein